MADQLYTRGDNKVFPNNFIENIKDKESEASLTEILQGFNCYFLSYTGSVETTRLQIPKLLRKQGLWITYVNYQNNVITEWYDGISIEDSKFKNSSNWRNGNNRLVGELSISSNGNWVINGVETEFKARGETGITPLLRIGNNNKLQVTYTKGKTWQDISDYIVPKFRMYGASNNNIGKVQISMDLGNTWKDLSGDIVNNLRISKYVETKDELPDSGIAEGTIYAVGPFYDEENDPSHEHSYYELWNYAYKGNSLTWINLGYFNSLSVGIAQEIGDSENLVMSQKIVTDLCYIKAMTEEEFAAITNPIEGAFYATYE